jgi:hypothetical protein
MEGSGVVTYPLIPNEFAANSANPPFSGQVQGVRTLNPEIPGGSIALVATNNTEVQFPPASLEKVHAFREKRIAFNKSVLRNEEEVSGINSALLEFLQGMSLATTVFMSVNVGERMCGTQPICGQLLVQEDRQMTATSTSLAGLGTSREEVALSGIADVLAWQHTLEVVDYDLHPDYPKLLDKLDRILAPGNVGDSERSRWPAHEVILRQSMTWQDDCRPIMLPESMTWSCVERKDGLLRNTYNSWTKWMTERARPRSAYQQG